MKLSALLTEVHRRSLWQVAGIYLATSWGVLNAVDVLTGVAGLPDWTPSMAVILLLIGFPIVTATAVIQNGLRGRAAADADSPPEESVAEQSKGAAERGAELKALFTWRNAILGGVAAGALLLATGGAYLAMWSLGIGPTGSLMAQGVLESRDPVLLAEFEDRTGSEDLGALVSEALAVDLGTSPVVSLLGDDAVAGALRLMGREGGEPVTSELAREIALRANIKAYIEGEVASLGSRFLIVARIVSPTSGEVLGSFREEAEDEDQLLPAIDRTSQRLREKLGESLREIRLGAPLEQVTTASFEALRKLSQAEVAEEDGDYSLAERLLDEAIALDPEFAMAYRKKAVLFFNSGQTGERLEEASSRAYENRHRLTDRERYLTEANYHSNVTGDDVAALEAFDALLRVYPDDGAALNNSANLLRRLSRFDEALERYERAIAGGTSASSVAYFNRGVARFLVGDRSGTLEAIEAYRDRYPGHIYHPITDFMETLVVGELDGIEGRIRAMQAAPDIDFFQGQYPRFGIAAAVHRGAFGRAAEWSEALPLQRPVAPFHNGILALSTGAADLQFWVLDDPDAAVETLRTQLAGPFEAVALSERPWAAVVSLLAMAGRADLARDVLTQWDTDQSATAPEDRAHREAAGAMVAMGEGRLDEALDQVEAAARAMACPRCFEHQRAVVLERLGRHDEAIAVWETVRDYPVDLWAGGFEYIMALKNLSRLHDLADSPQGEISAHRELVEAWANADERLQPQVRQARERIAALGG